MQANTTININTTTSVLIGIIINESILVSRLSNLLLIAVVSCLNSLLALLILRVVVLSECSINKHYKIRLSSNEYEV